MKAANSTNAGSHGRIDCGVFPVGNTSHSHDPRFVYGTIHRTGIDTAIHQPFTRATHCLPSRHNHVITLHHDQPFCKRQPHLLTRAITSDHRSALSPHRIILRLSRILRLPLTTHANNTSSLSLGKSSKTHWPVAEMNARKIDDEETNSEQTRQRRQSSLAALVYVWIACIRVCIKARVSD